MSNGSGLKPGRTTIEKKVKLYKVYNWLCIIRSNNYKTTQNIDPKITDFCSTTETSTQMKVQLFLQSVHIKHKVGLGDQYLPFTVISLFCFFVFFG